MLNHNLIDVLVLMLAFCMHWSDIYPVDLLVWSQVPEFEEAAFKAPLNKLVRVKTKHGWHLLQVLSERSGFSS